MRRLTAILFLGIFILQAFGYFFTYRVIKWHIHKEVTSQISLGQYHSSALTRISLTQEQLRLLEWEEENEFRYQEEWYDVIESKRSGDSTIFFCIKDDKDTQLVSNVESLLQDIDKESSKGNFRYTLKKLSDTYYSEIHSTLIFILPEQSIFSIQPAPSVVQTFTSQLSPPPKV